MVTVDRAARGRRGALTLTIAVVTATAVTACGSAAPSTAATAPSPAASVLRAPDMVPGTVPAAPLATPLLTITGRIAATNTVGALRLDRPELDRLGLLEMTVNDPWAKQRLPLQGVWLRDLIALARPDAAATTLHMTALDDYQVDLTLTDVRTDEIFLATRNAQGAELPVEDGGPTRVVFADDLATRFSPDLWIWNITTVEVR